MNGTLVIGLALGIGAAQAQATNPPRIAFLYQTAGACKPDGRYNAFEQGMRDLGYVPGRTIAIDFRCHARPEDMRAIAAEAVRNKVAVMVVGTPPQGLAARAGPREVPIV